MIIGWRRILLIPPKKAGRSRCDCVPLFGLCEEISDQSSENDGLGGYRGLICKDERSPKYKKSLTFSLGHTLE